MSRVVVVGSLRAPPEELRGLHPHMERVLTATRAEDGCLLYVCAIDVLDPGLLRISEIWRDEAALRNHLQQPHLAEWRAALTSVGPQDREFNLFEVSVELSL